MASTLLQQTSPKSIPARPRFFHRFAPRPSPTAPGLQLSWLVRYPSGPFLWSIKAASLMAYDPSSKALWKRATTLCTPPPPNPKFSGGPPYMPSVDVIPELDRSSESSSVCPSSSTLPKALGAHSTPLFDASMLSPTMLY